MLTGEYDMNNAILTLHAGPGGTEAQDWTDMLFRMYRRYCEKSGYQVDILDYMAVVDCGIPINPALARIQTEGGIVQGIGHTLFENVTYDTHGKPIESSFMQYKVPTRLDMGKLKVEFEHSYEPTGPFGAKSIGEIVINTPAPAIAHAIYRATGAWHREIPITPEKIVMSMIEK
jgi:CO/xanthine dehydrogenase Mo-binding subunit